MCCEINKKSEKTKQREKKNQPKPQINLKHRKAFGKQVKNTIAWFFDCVFDLILLLSGIDACFENCALTFCVWKRNNFCQSHKTNRRRFRKKEERTNVDFKNLIRNCWDFVCVLVMYLIYVEWHIKYCCFVERVFGGI